MGRTDAGGSRQRGKLALAGILFRTLVRMAKLALALLALAGFAAASDVCTLPHYARGGRLERLVCGESFNQDVVGAVAAQTKQTPLDHDGSTTETFTQRYWVNKDYWNSTKAVRAG